MKIQITVLIDFEDDEPEFDFAPPPPPPSPPSLLNGLIQRLLREVCEGRNPDIWEDNPHGSFLKS